MITADGSPTIRDTATGEHFHSLHGAVSESMKVFVENGFLYMAPRKETISILEMGFGTGLNALLTLVEANRLEKRIHYSAVEKYPLSSKESDAYYNGFAQADMLDFEISALHAAPWGKSNKLSPDFILEKFHADIREVKLSGCYDLVYFDAFSPQVQPELWTTEVFSMIAGLMAEDGVLVTYSSKGIVKQALRSCGFIVERLPGPVGKRHVLRASINRKVV
ncbi:MAG: tRNA (5-methylaminomethyl-2-thiouridine)(34)-methyltransferase MnmD [Bacteroidetes bacterium]|nr:tRNA (5-methylaminomethyl-2-thiouridine)(34)-methyltransferase MnmD [Bacteroidota bacterium]